MRFVMGLAALAAVAAFALPAQASTQYTVYCANGKIEIDTRTPAEMKSQRGACPMSQGFNYRSDAESFAKKNFGGTGASCSCR